jgi:hypothetical protein
MVYSKLCRSPEAMESGPVRSLPEPVSQEGFELELL